MKFTYISLSAVCLGLVLHAGVQAQSMQTFVLGASNKPGFPSQEMARLQIEQSGADTKWKLSANWNDAYNVSNPFVMGLEFDMRSGRINQSSLPLFDVTGQIGLKSFGNNGVFFETANNARRFTDGEAASWVFKNTRLADFVVQNLHINAMYNGQSVKFAPMTPVPEPASYAMLLCGLAAVSLLWRKPQQRELNVRPS